MIYSRPWAFALLVFPAALAALWAAGFRWKERVYQTAGDPAVLKRLADPLAGRHQRVKALLQVLAAALFALALAGPRWGQSFQEVRRRGVDVIVAVDVSACMLAEDVPPNRLTQAKRELGLLINGLEGDRAGLVAFAGKAFLQCPLTLDYGAVRTLLDLVGPELIPAPGTSVGAAIEAACDAFERNEREHKALVILTDGEDHSGRLPGAVKRAQAEGVRIFAIGFGSPQGEIIPVRDDQGNLVEYKKDKQGQTVVSKLNEQDLLRMASATGGRYYRASQGEVEVERILADIRGMDKKNLDSRVYGQFEDRYRWPLAALLFLLLLEFLWPEVRGHWRRVLGDIRRGSILVLLALVLFPPAPAHAAGRTPEAERHRRLAEKDPLDPRIQYNLGASLYREGDYKSALEAFDRAHNGAPDDSLKARSAYNAGNALFRQGRFGEAAEKYKQALRLNPQDQDAKHNLELARRMLAERREEDKKDAKSSEEKGDPKPGGEAQPGDKPGDDKARAAPPKDGMTREDAERLLQAVENQEKEARRKIKKDQPKSPAAGEDW
jgi:Ca-activated chloride channel family protein